MHDILLATETILPYIKYLFEEDISVAVTDREKFILSLEGETIHMNAKSGDPIPKGGGVREALNTGKCSVKDVPKDVYGVAFRSYAIPIRDENNQVIGVLTLAKNYERSEKIANISKELNNAIEHIATIVTDFSEELISLQNQNAEITHSVSSVYDTTKQTDDVLDMVHKIAKRSSILGLNASIEAARAGEAGKGFTVVAKEIQQMGHSTLDSVVRINDLMKSVKEKVDYIYEKVHSFDENFVRQTEDIKDIINYIEELNNKSEELAEFSSQL